MVFLFILIMVGGKVVVFDSIGNKGSVEGFGIILNFDVFVIGKVGLLGIGFY